MGKILHTYSVVKTDFSVIVNNLSWQQAIDLAAANTDFRVLTIKNNHISAARKVTVEVYNEMTHVDNVHIEKTIINHHLDADLI